MHFKSVIRHSIELKQAALSTLVTWKALHVANVKGFGCMSQMEGVVCTSHYPLLLTT